MPFTYTPYLPHKDDLLLAWVQHFITVANANLADTGLTAGQMTALNDLFTDCSVAVGTHQAAYTVARMSTTERNEARRLLREMTRALAQTVRNRSETPLVLKQELWLRAPEAPPAPGLPDQPQDLAAAGFSAGYNLLKWSRSGNIAGTLYVVESRPRGDGPWSYVGTTTKLRLKHTGQTPGFAIDYRVYAQRGETVSPASEVVSVYAANPNVPLEMAA